MKNLFGKAVSGLLLGIGISSGAWAAGPTPWMDATHLFDAEVQALALKVPLETKTGFAKRTRAPEPVKKIYKVGDVEKFWTKNIVEDKFVQIDATLRAIGKSCYIFVENGQNVTDGAITKIQRTYDEKIYPVDTGNFGSEWKPGVDGDERVFLLMLDIKDGWKPNTNSGYVAGYFFAGDEFLQSQIPANIPVKSNEREIMYLDLYPGDPNEDKYLAVVAHEFQHMIHFIHDPKEKTWVNEACSQIATFLCGFGHQGQIMSWMQTPDNNMVAWAKEQMLANYGQVYMWNYFLTNRYLPTDAARQEFFRKLVDDKAQGSVGFQTQLKKYKTDMRTAFIEFCITNFVNNPKLGKGQYAYDKSLARFRLPPTAQLKTLPAKHQDKVQNWSADAVKVDLTTAKENIKVDFSGGSADFVVAAVLSDSRDQQTPLLAFMTPVRDQNLALGGSLNLAVGSFDTLNLVVIAMPKTAAQYDANPPLPPVDYQISVTDAGQTVARAPRTPLATNRLIAEYQDMSVALQKADANAQVSDLMTLDALSYEITKSAREGLETGVTKPIDELLRAGRTQASREALRPLAHKVAEQISSWKLQNPSLTADLEKKAESLKGF